MKLNVIFEKSKLDSILKKVFSKLTDDLTQARFGGDTRIIEHVSGSYYNLLKELDKITK